MRALPLKAWEQTMPYYRLYHVRRERFTGVEDFDAEDDVQAVRHAQTLNGSSTAELWCGGRRIKVFVPRSDRSSTG
jgi:hypothetical protein